ncbi:MAG: GHKL domain-containing protein, partial [Leptospira sp.]|nr:GHKL domain-containing protein [Leptospira sp.]
EILELALLSESINTMSRRLKGQFSDLTLEKEKFDSLLQNLKEGVFAIDPEHRILFQNRSIPGTLIPENSQSRKIDFVVKHKEFLDFLNSHIEKGIDGKTKIEIGERYYSIRFYHLKTDDKIFISIGVIADKTEEIQSQTMKEQFVQNASHELKTPITSIKGYTETLIAKIDLRPDSPERKFIDAILRNTDRMIRIVDDMLTISQLESNQAIFQPERFYLDNFVKDLKFSIDGFVRLKNQNFVFDIPEKFEIIADLVLMEHLLLNLIQNASNYSPDNKKIELRARKTENSFLIQVIDEGIGISEENAKRIFERFYRVDTNRSRKEGGTGLGLSIVKHIVKLHGGEISVSSNNGAGSIFSVSIPITGNK